MKPYQPVALCALAGLLLSFAPTRAQEQRAPSEFSSRVIDLGVVVSDLERSVAFYTDLIGFRESPGFGVEADFCTAAGLTRGHGLAIRVLRLPGEDAGTSLKLMSVPEAEPRKSDTTSVPSQLGFRYLTLHTNGLGPILARLAAAGVKPLAEGPVPLPGQDRSGPHLALVRDPDGNLIELIGKL